VYTIVVQTNMGQIELTKNTVVGLLKASSKAEDLLAKVLKPYEISLQQFNVLRILRGRKEKLANLSTIQKRMVHKNSNTSRLIDKLIEKLLVERKTCEENRRKIELIITPKGKSILSELDLVIEIAETEILKPLDLEEQKSLRKLLNKINLN
jgi:DNA-binding MarR family transcriptional regulator|tara:strand:- start:577 stop:1032 length:456 start_codon:yes stop_codon:yes gene_type:complete